MPRMCTCELMNGSYKYGLKTYSLLMILLGIGFFVFFYFFTIGNDSVVLTRENR